MMKRSPQRRMARQSSTPLQRRIQRSQSPKLGATGFGARKRSFPRDLYRFYIRNSPLVLLTLLGTILVIHSRINRAEAPTIHSPELPMTKEYDATILLRAEDNFDSRKLTALRIEATKHLSDYSETSNPVIPRSVYKPKASQPLRVILIGRKEGPLSAPAESSQQYFPADLFLDGLDRSDYLKVIQWIEYDPLNRTTRIHQYHSNPRHETLLVAADWAALSRDCHALERVWEEAALHGAVSNRTNVFFLYMDLSASSQTVVCPRVQDSIPKSRIRIARRGITKGRHWNQTKGWIEPGCVQPNEGSIVSGGPTLHLPYFLRESLVTKLESVAASLGVTTTKSFVQSTQRRKNDVSHFWRKADYSHYSFLRRLVGTRIMESNWSRKIRWLVRTLGDGDALEVHQVDQDYVAGMVGSKIVVIAQKDEWEDHYRLMEALASGALILSDVMLAPPNGLKNRTNIIFYDSPASLIRLIEYYTDSKQEKKRLAIAQRGFEFALGRHRSWQRMESMLFGTALTQVDKPGEAAPQRKHPPKATARHNTTKVATA